MHLDLVVDKEQSSWTCCVSAEVESATATWTAAGARPGQDVWQSRRRSSWWAEAESEKIGQKFIR